MLKTYDHVYGAGQKPETMVTVFVLQIQECCLNTMALKDTRKTLPFVPAAVIICILVLDICKCKSSIVAPHPKLLSSSSVSVFKKSLKVLFYSDIHASVLQGRKSVVCHFTQTVQLSCMNALCSSSFMLLTGPLCKLHTYRENVF